MAAVGIFDAHRPPPRELIDDCVHCGFCLPSCPTYVLWGQEADSPRGRIYLMRAGLEGHARWGDSFQRHFDTCLGCMACLTACPSGVQYDALIEATRAQVERQGTRRIAEKLFRRLVFALFPHPGRLRVVQWPLWLYERSGVGALVRKAGFLTLVPERLAALARLASSIHFQLFPHRLPRRVAAAGARRRRVGLLLGCVQRVFFAHVNDATIRVLSAEGCDVEIPPGQGCCGALMLHAGLEDEACAAARRLIDEFTSLDLDHIVVNAAGCGSAMKEYGRLLRDDPQYADRAREFAAKCVDVSELLAGLEPQATRHPVPLRVVYHDACHLRHAQRVIRPPRALLETIPGLTVQEPADADLCCGSAGIYNLLEPEAAAALRDRKVSRLLETRPEVIVSANPGCLMQIGSGLQIAGRPIRTAHIVEIVDASIRARELEN